MMWDTILNKGSQFLSAWIEVKIIDGIREFTKGFTAQALADVIQSNTDIALQLMSALLPTDEEEKKKVINNARGILKTMSIEKLLSLFEEAAPEHAGLLGENPEWLIRQLNLVKEIL